MNEVSLFSHASRCFELRARHPLFCYRSFSYEPRVSSTPSSGLSLRIRFVFEAGPNLRFSPEVELQGLTGNLDTASLAPFVFQLGLIESLSYWKAVCSPIIEVAAGSLAPEEEQWWNDVLSHGMREFYYRNKLDPGDVGFVRFRSHGTIPRVQKTSDAEGPAILLLSGGKDSAVSLELLSLSKTPFRPLLLNPTQAALDLANEVHPRQSLCGEKIIARRTIDPLLLELNRQGYLNGHTPFSAYLAFLALLVAEATGAQSIIASNERSSEEGNVTLRGVEVNHQWSKSLAFEERFRSYTAALGSRVSYFSLLRPLYEIQIAREFSRHQRYFPLFRSCNRGARENAWCSSCPKCLFTFVLLAPFLEERVLESIFGRNLFYDGTLVETLQAMIGVGEKPFECVATFGEMRAVLDTVIARYRERLRPLPPLLERIEPYLPRGGPPLEKFLSSWTTAHHIPEPLERVVRQLVTQHSFSGSSHAPG